jgi:tetratricopeptide (TPR) repeat protein
VRRIALSFLLLVLHAGSAHALTLLTEAKHGVFRHDPVTGTGSAQLSVGRDRALVALEDPTVCPSSATLRISFYPTATNLVTGGPEVALPCARWRRIPGGYLYRDPDGTAGGVRTVRYTTRGLFVDARTPGFTPVVGPVGYAQLWLRVGDTRYLVRLHDFLENDSEAVVSRRASRDGAAGEAAFWDTLWGDADRHQDALRYLERAVARDRRDARSHFLLAMQYLNLYGQETADLNHPSERAKRLVLESRAAFDRAVPLLWDGTNGDSRVPGFAAAATYAKGVGFRDARLTAQGVDELEYATTINTLFNSFDLLAVAPAVSNRDPLYGRVLELLDVTFPEVAGLCGTQPEICFNDGMAPHNLEGTFILFGDIYAKGGRTESARGYYGSALSLGEQSGWDPHFVAAVRDRLDNLEQRVALYQDDDPSNDPPFVGAGGAGSCAYCHRK